MKGNTLSQSPSSSTYKPYKPKLPTKKLKICKQTLSILMQIISVYFMIVKMWKGIENDQQTFTLKNQIA